jgi:hypothetical protein
MINQKETLHVMSNVIFPFSRDNRLLIAPVGNVRTSKELRLEIPMIYIKTTVCALTVLAAIMIGLIVPWLAIGLAF